MAARNCRKRKIDQIKQLEDDVQKIRCRKTELIQEHDRLLLERSRWTEKVKRLHDYVLKVSSKFNKGYLIQRVLIFILVFRQQSGHMPLELQYVHRVPL